MVNSKFLTKCSPAEINSAAQALKLGNLVAFPTETVYGLGADATDAKSISRIYEVKGRPTNHPLIIHVSSREMLQVWAKDIPEYAIKLAHDFWPGPMTIVVKSTDVAKSFVTGAQDSVAIRIPDNPIALALLKAFEKIGGLGIAAPSANRFGHVSPTSPSDVISELAEFFVEGDLVLDGGNCSVGIESTIIDCTNSAPQILRPGAITSDLIFRSTLIHVITHGSIKHRVSGGLEKHYAPRAKVILDATPESGQGYVAFSCIPTPKGVIRIASPNNSVEFAQILYQSLRKADQMGLSEIVVSQPEGDGLEIGIRDRLKKASQGR
jgi:L-threonylcarbamoyladenylate synthase